MSQAACWKKIRCNAGAAKVGVTAESALNLMVQGALNEKAVTPYLRMRSALDDEHVAKCEKADLWLQAALEALEGGADLPPEPSF